MDYLRDPAEIYRRSFELVRAQTDLSGLPEDLAAVALRLVRGRESTNSYGICGRQGNIRKRFRSTSGSWRKRNGRSARSITK